MKGTDVLRILRFHDMGLDIVTVGDVAIFFIATCQYLTQKFKPKGIISARSIYAALCRSLQK